MLVEAGLVVIKRRKQRSAIIRLTSDAGFELKEVPRKNGKREVYLPTAHNEAEDQEALRRIAAGRASCKEQLTAFDQAEAAILAKYDEG